MTVSRRGLITGFAGLLAAPAIVRTSSLMKISQAPSLILPYRLLDKELERIASQFLHAIEGDELCRSTWLTHRDTALALLHG